MDYNNLSDPPLTSENPEHAINEEPVRHDFFFQWHITERCNLRCIHCYQEETDNKELSFIEIKDVIGEIRETLRAWEENYKIGFSPGFNITGGEPFLRRDFFQILEEIRKDGADIYILSNGTMIDKERAEALSRLGVKGVQISVEGPLEIHDRIRGEGSFTKAMRGTGNLLDAGMTVTLNATLSDLNGPYIHELVSLAAGAGVQNLGFSRLVPCGRGGTLLNEMMDAQKVKKLYLSLSSVQVKGLNIVTGDPIASQMNLKGASDTGCTAYGGCAAGVSGLTIRPDGTINPCRRLDIPIGNIMEDSLREVWATSEVLNLLRDKSKYKGKCGACCRWANCRGCRAIAYACSMAKGEADFLSEDPQCFL
ncbi:MAG: radical SAM protein [Nitrospiraceae bacterium]|nr:MAG: radical SAM protein [Nitrospiraceae bacterium]